MKSVCLLLAAVVAAPSIAAAQAPAAPPAPSAKPANKTDRVVCRTDDQIGSRLAKRKICMTVAEWREVGRQSGDWLEHKSTYLGRPGGG